MINEDISTYDISSHVPKDLMLELESGIALIDLTLMVNMHNKN